jgi:hypothetical protein
VIDPAKLNDAVSVLPSEEFDFRFAFAGAGQCKAAPGLEESIIFERQFDSYGTVQTLGFRDSSDRNEGVFGLSDEATPVSRV